MTTPLDPDVLLPSPVLARWTDRVDAAAGAECANLFAAAMRRTLARTLHPLDDGTVFVITGDIPAMWLRDAATQMRPYVRLLALDDDPRLGALTEVIGAVVRRQFAYVAHDPYANAFNAAPNGNCHEPRDLGDDPWLWERKYEIDSLCFPFQLAEQLAEATGTADHFDDAFHAAAVAAIDTLSVELDHEGSSSYRFVRPDTVAQDTLPRDGLGSPVAVTGMTWSGFRPSDDACTYGYLVPANLMAAHTLDGIAARLRGSDDGLAARAGELAAGLRDGVAQHGRVVHLRHGEIWAYEVDGLGSALLADDANMPSLLSLPLVAGIAADDPRYVRTRRFVLSGDNPYFYRGRVAAGPGSPHTPVDHVWPIALAVAGLTSPDPAESMRLLQLIAETTADTEYVHESFHVDDPTRYTREWFSWADSMFCELALHVCAP
ncbi:glycoside hydrolase family 125 protein [Gordonia sp. X0973]|uniref:glycoside hydrolase family 125 protein n=1 Tax=Gordonia sp. X0973 TaxID=2742602 RepID=UPI000F534E26|nr:glycoside hydrolase family 125 protein [Gordonia sp. X0973]QKT07010.1 glycoside hydrolase family 125 protein [Gordonia sp. X0973]